MSGMAGMYHRGIGADHHHKGTGHGGNKSMLSWRVDIGVPGYTGYIPSSASIGLPVKGSTSHTGKVGGGAHAERLSSTITSGNLPKTMYSDKMSIPPCNTGEEKAALYAATDKSKGGYWITSSGRDGPIKKFVSTTTYSAEIQQGDTTAPAVQGLTESMRPTLPVTQNSMKAADRTNQGAETALSAPLGYVSNYNSMVVKSPLTGGLVAAGLERPASGTAEEKATDSKTGRPREKVLKRCQTPVFYGETLYMRNMGTYGSDPLGRSAKSEVDLTKHCSTSEFNAGTTRATSQIPGYSGFIASSKENPQAQNGGDAARPSSKDAMLLSALDQYSRDQLPRYGGFRPQVPENIKPAGDPTKATTQGIANHQATNSPMKAVDHANFHNADVGTMSFFTAGQVSVSDNGKAVAERYYHTVRPKEGLPRVYHPSRTTVVGSKFS